MARGGKRNGTPGKAYSNRSDMQQPVKVVPGQGYGDRQKLEQAQQAIPLPAQPTPAPVGPAAAPQGPQVVPVPLSAPSERPGEPLTAGLPSGPGGGPEMLSTAGPAADAIGQQLRMLYAQNPNNDLLRLIELHDTAQ